ncbi:MAG: sulfotransferase [Gammaproteobacteria bacterium]|nr:sulfotransferase [Gammaproteobacteria bacterium]
MNVPRSGSTLLCTVLDAHPRLSIVIESVWFSYHAVNLRRLGKKPAIQREETLFEYLKSAPQIERLAPDEDEIRRAIAGSDGKLEVVFDRLCSSWSRQRAEPNSICGEKSCAHALYIDQIHRAYPEAKFIHLIRDPRATVYSLSKKSFGGQSNSVYVNIHVWRRYHDGMIRSLRTVADTHKLTVYYEDFVIDTEKQTRRICEFIGVDFDPVMMEHHKLHREIPKRFGSQKANDPVSDSFVDQWRTSLTPLQISCIEDLTLDSDLVRRYELVRPSVNVVARTVAMVYARWLGVVLGWLERIFARVRGGPFVWSEAGRLLKKLLRIAS